MSRRRIGPQSEQAEIDLGHLAGWRLDDARRHRRRPEPPLAPREAMQGAVGNPPALSGQPPMDLRQSQPLGQPGPRPEPLGRQPLSKRRGPARLVLPRELRDVPKPARTSGVDPWPSPRSGTYGGTSAGTLSVSAPSTSTPFWPRTRRTYTA